jgi:hypothetical protein
MAFSARLAFSCCGWVDDLAWHGDDALVAQPVAGAVSTFLREIMRYYKGRDLPVLAW